MKTQNNRIPTVNNHVWYEITLIIILNCNKMNYHHKIQRMKIDDLLMVIVQFFCYVGVFNTASIA
jgi:hypothetical protein